MIFEKFRFLKKVHISRNGSDLDSDQKISEGVSYANLGGNMVAVPKKVYRERQDDPIPNRCYIIINSTQAIVFYKSGFSGIWEGGRIVPRKEYLFPANLVPMEDAVICWWTLPDDGFISVNINLAVVVKKDIKLAGVKLFQEETTLMDFILENRHKRNYIAYLLTTQSNEDHIDATIFNGAYTTRVTLSEDSVILQLANADAS